jgi:hypothetical protein
MPFPVSMLIGGALALAGLILASWGWWSDRAKGRLRCPKCWYSLEGVAAPAQCPECGAISSIFQLRRTRRRWWAVVLGAAALLTGVGVGAGKDRVIAWGWRLLPAWRVQQRVAAGSHGEFEVIIFENRRPDWIGPPHRLEIRHRGETVFRMEAFHPEVGTYQMPPNVKPVDGLGTKLDLNHDTTPDLWVSMPSGGTGAIGVQYLFSLDDSVVTPSITPSAIIPYMGWFEDVDQDGFQEFIAVDNTFAYWWTPGFANPYLSVPVEVLGTTLHPMSAWMWKTVAPELVGPDGVHEDAIAEEVEAAKANTEANFGLWVSRPLKVALSLIYCGHAERAWSFLKEVWPERFNGEKTVDQAIREIEAKVQTSPLWRGTPRASVT